MMHHRTIARGFVALLGISLGFVLCAVPAHADADHKGQPTIYGKTYGEWSAQWWQWALAGPDGANAVQDTTGEFCAVHQPKGKVWFLAGSFGVPGVERTCTIPPHRALFYPLINTVWTDCPGTPDEDLTDTEIREILTTLSAAGDRVCHITSTLDGVSISSLQILTVRTQSPTFTSTLPENHLPGLGGCGFELPVGETGRQISEGYWAMLPPLSPGEHVLTLHGAACNAATGAIEFETGVTYHLTVLGGDHHDD
jgi:hypothetical protein